MDLFDVSVDKIKDSNSYCELPHHHHRPKKGFLRKLKRELSENSVIYMIIFVLSVIISIMLSTLIEANNEFKDYLNGKPRNFQERVIDRIKNNKLTDTDKKALDGLEVEDINAIRKIIGK